MTVRSDEIGIAVDGVVTVGSITVVPIGRVCISPIGNGETLLVRPVKALGANNGSYIQEE